MTDVTTGELLPDIALQAPDGSASTIHAARDGRAAVVYFLRSSTCPVCAAHVRSLLAMQGSGELAGRALLLVVPGEPADASRVGRKHALGDDGVVWASGSGHAEVGLGTFLALQHSGVFVLDETGTVVHHRTAVIPTQSLDEKELRRVLTSA